MWSELDIDKLEKEEYRYMPPLTVQERDDLIEFVFYHLYNSGKSSKPTNILAWFKERRLEPYPTKEEILTTLIKKEAPKV